MTPNEKANELVDKFKDYVHGYVGSSMLSNHEYPDQILAQAKKVAIICVEEIIAHDPLYPNTADWDETGSHKYFYEAQRETAMEYWKNVLIEINNLSPERNN